MTRIDFERFNLGNQIVVNNPVNEDSSRVVFVQYLLENGRGGTIGGRTEFEVREKKRVFIVGVFTFLYLLTQKLMPLDTLTSSPLFAVRLVYSKAIVRIR